MSTNYASIVSTKAPKRDKKLPIDQGPGTLTQAQKAPGEKKNNAGGYSFVLNDWDKLDRFLILGAEGGTYYVGENKLVKDNAKTVQKLIKEDGARVVNRVVEISVAGRAPKNDPALFVLALCVSSGIESVVAAGFEALPKVARIGTHLFTFSSYADELRGWGKSLKRGIANWYVGMPIDKLAYQVVKYQQRNGWSHRDLLRLAHPQPSTPELARLFNWVSKSSKYPAQDAALPELVDAFITVHEKGDVKVSLAAIEKYGLTHEMLPTEQLKSKEIWEALLVKMNVGAMIRSLGRMGAIGVLDTFGDGAKMVIDRLANTELVKKSRVHPIQVLSALNVYGNGHGERGNLTWKPNQRIIDSLNDAFYATFANIEPTGENYFIGIDCSGSMFGANVNGIPGITAAHASAVMAMATMKVEKNYWVGGFNTQMSELKINANMRLDAVMAVIQKFNWGGTDCSLPMITADKLGITNVNKFLVYTDNETWAGRVKPNVALTRYREKFNTPAKLIVAGTAATQFTIADPNDSGMLDLVGFDSATPQLISEF